MTSAYASLAQEYYDTARHPTCASFRYASQLLLERLIDPEHAGLQSTCEVGAGASLLAALLARSGGGLERLLITDESAEMLAHSRVFEAQGARLARTPAAELPVADRSIELLVASLADPYDVDSFWQETRRVLAPQGVAVVTTPAWEWASRFRINGEPSDQAAFILASGEPLYVPSYIRPVSTQKQLIESSGLQVDAITTATKRELADPAPKLASLSPNDPVVRAYSVRPLEQ